MILLGVYEKCLIRCCLGCHFSTCRQHMSHYSLALVIRGSESSP